MIWLTQGQFTLVDDEDYDFLNHWKWSATKIAEMFYAVRCDSENKMIYMHKEVVPVEAGSKIKIDHSDRNGLNNQRHNLRRATHSQNLCNANSRKNSLSKYKGVGLFKRDNKWRAYIQKDGKFEHLGLYENEIDAAEAYNNRAIVLHGEFARLNVISV